MSRQLEFLLCKIHQRKHCVLVGNATAGLFLALKVHDVAGKKVVIPNGVCPNVPLSIYLAGAIPIYIDVSKDNLGLSLDALKAIPEVAAIIAVHSYGMPCEMMKLEAYCAQEGIVIIEDMAAAQGAKINIRPVGSFGSISVVSFGAGKIVDVGNGGAILTDDSGLYRAIKSLDSKLPDCKDEFLKDIFEVSSYHTQLYNDIYLKRQYNQLPNLFKQRMLATGSSFLYRFVSRDVKDIHIKLQDLAMLIKKRKKNIFLLYEKLYGLENIGIHLFDFPDGSVPWRFNLLIDNNRDQLLNWLLIEQLKISSWYPSVDLFFESRSQSLVETPICDDISSRILNIWINETIEESYLSTISGRIIELCSSDLQALH